MVGRADVMWHIYYCQQYEVCLYKALRFDIPITAREDTALDSEGVVVALEYKIVPAAVNTIGFEFNRK